MGDESSDDLHDSRSVPLADRETLVQRLTELEQTNKVLTAENSRLCISHRLLQNQLETAEKNQKGSRKFLWGSLFGAAAILGFIFAPSVGEMIGEIPLAFLMLLGLGVMIMGILGFSRYVVMNHNDFELIHYICCLCWTIITSFGLTCLVVIMYEDTKLQIQKNKWGEVFKRAAMLKIEPLPSPEVSFPASVPEKKRVEY